MEALPNPLPASEALTRKFRYAVSEKRWSRFTFPGLGALASNSIASCAKLAVRHAMSFIARMVKQTPLKEFALSCYTTIIGASRMGGSGLLMSLSARLTFSQVGLFFSILVFLVVRGAFVVLTGGFLWTQPGSYLLIAVPLHVVIFFGFGACVVSYGYSYLGLWLLDHGQHLLGLFIIVAGVIVIPGVLAAYSWVSFGLT